MANQDCQEVRPYTLNADRAVKKKLRIPFLSVGLEEKNKGQCLVAQLDLDNCGAATEEGAVDLVQLHQISRSKTLKGQKS